MKPLELKDARRAKKMTQADFSNWLGVSKHTVVAWEVGRNPIPDWVESRIQADSLQINPSLTLEQFRVISDIADKKGQSVDQWISDLIKNAIQPPT